MKKTGMLLVLAASLMGCKEEKVYDVEYYLAHPEECKTQVEKCKNNPGQLGNTPNCQNALAADAKRGFLSKKSVQLPVLHLK